MAAVSARVGSAGIARSGHLRGGPGGPGGLVARV